MKHKQSKACDISKKVKDIVWQRDNQQCIFCGSYQAMPNMHYIPRSKGGLGIPENIGTGCIRCHHLLDNSEYRAEMLSVFKKHLASLYPNWEESNLIYNKWRAFQCST